MNTNPYESPSSELEVEQALPPEDIMKKIKGGWVAAIVSLVMTAGIMILSMTTGALNGLFDIWTSLDLILIAVLAFGIYKKSRVASTLMLLYFLASKIWFIVETGKPQGIVVSIIFLYFYFQAMIGTYQYHSWLRKA